VQNNIDQMRKLLFDRYFMEF